MTGALMSAQGARAATGGITRPGPRRPSPQAVQVTQGQEAFQRFLEEWAGGPAPDIARVREHFSAESPPAASLGADYDLEPVDVTNVRGEWVRHRSSSAKRRLIFCHGGGYVMGSPESGRRAASVLSRDGDCSVFLLRYRLAPEHPFPAQIEDGLAAHAYVAASGPAGDQPAERVFLGGASAGGGLALALALRMRDQAMAPAAGILALGPYVDASTPPYPTEASRRVTEVFNRMHLAGRDLRDPLVSPTFADLRGLPPIFLQTGDADFFVDEQIRFAKKARQAGGEVVAEVWRGMPHVWQMTYPFVPEAEPALGRLATFLKSK